MKAQAEQVFKNLQAALDRGRREVLRRREDEHLHHRHATGAGGPRSPRALLRRRRRRRAPFVEVEGARPARLMLEIEVIAVVPAQARGRGALLRPDAAPRCSIEPAEDVANQLVEHTDVPAFVDHQTFAIGGRAKQREQRLRDGLETERKSSRPYQHQRRRVMCGTNSADPLPAVAGRPEPTRERTTALNRCSTATIGEAALPRRRSARSRPA